MNRTKLSRGVGQWVDGERFFDREAEVRDLIELLDEGANVLMTAPRRTGKTSLMKETSRLLADRYYCLYVDVEDCKTAADAVVAIGLATYGQRSLWSKTREVFRNVLGLVENVGFDELSIKIRDGVAGDWREKGSRLLSDLAGVDRPVVLFLDEVPILVNRLLKGSDYIITSERRDRVDELVSWLRAMTIAHKNAIRFVVTGSIGLEPILRQAGLSAAINTLHPFELEPWSGPTAIACLQALANNYGLVYEAGAPEAVVHHLGCCIPHHVQVFFDMLYTDAERRPGNTVAVDDVDRVYRERMLSSKGHAELSHYEERLKLVLGKARLPLALDLLTEASVRGALGEEVAIARVAEHVSEPTERGERLREVLGILEHDGYLRRETDGSYRFISLLVRDWWRARFEFSLGNGEAR